MSSTDLLAVFAHPDDAELLAGGTLATAAASGHRVVILDLTRGELGSKGSPEIRAAEAAEAAAVLGIAERLNAGLPDGHLANTDATRQIVVRHLRDLQPQVVITHYLEGRHPDHRAASQLVRDSCFLSGLRNYPGGGKAFRPTKVCFAMGYREDPVKPTFVVDISAQFERKLQAVACFKSQWDATSIQAGELYPTGQPFFELLRTQDARTGSLIRGAYGEAFWTAETIAVTDIVGVTGQSL
jgi:bacillithiol biosynthesis deacetylase BshB1